MREKPNRVWLEIERPPSDLSVDERNVIAEERAAKLSKVVEALTGLKEAVWWHDRKGRYCFTIDEAGGFVEAGDEGHWYNLDYIASRLEPPKPVEPHENICSIQPD